MWEDIGKRAARIKNRGHVRHFLTSDKDAMKLSGLIGEVNDSIQDRIVASNVCDVPFCLKLTPEQMQGILVILSVIVGEYVAYALPEC